VSAANKEKPRMHDIRPCELTRERGMARKRKRKLPVLAPHYGKMREAITRHQRCGGTTHQKKTIGRHDGMGLKWERVVNGSPRPL